MARLGVARLRLIEDVARQLLDCDLIITTTDTHSSRATVSQLAVQYWIPTVDVGGSSAAGHQAELPLLRLGMDALEPVEQATVFEWVVSRIVSWAHEGEQRREDAQEQMRAAVEAWPNMPEEAVEDVIRTYDPYFSFDIDHSFAGLAVIAQRLRTRFGIRVLPGWFAYEDAGEDAPYELEFGREEGELERTLIGEYDARTAHAVLRARVFEPSTF